MRQPPQTAAPNTPPNTIAPEKINSTTKLVTNIHSQTDYTTPANIHNQTDHTIPDQKQKQTPADALPHRGTDQTTELLQQERKSLGLDHTIKES